MQRLLITLAITVVSARGVWGVEVVLRPQATASGSVIRLGDVADLSAGGNAQLRDLAATPLMPSPTRGLRQFLRAAEIRDLLTARGVTVADLRFIGADMVEVGHGTPAASVQIRPTVETNADHDGDQTTRLATAVENYLRQRTGHDLWTVKVDVDDPLHAASAESTSRLTVSGGRAPWTGRQRLEITIDGEEKAVTVFAQVERLELAIVAVRPLEKGNLVRQVDVERRPLAGALPPLAVVSLEEVVGKEAVQSIRPNAVVLSNQVRAPIIVHRGQRVSVRARAAGISVRTYATAQQDGSLGDLVQAQSLNSKDKYAARVCGNGELEIMAAGAVAGEVAPAVRR